METNPAFIDLINKTSYYKIDKKDIWRLGQLAIKYKLKNWETTTDDNENIQNIYNITFNEFINGLETKLSSNNDTNGDNNTPISTESYTTFINGLESQFATDNSVLQINDYAFYNFSFLGGNNIPLTFNAAQKMGSHAFEKCISLEKIYGNKMADIGSYAFIGCQNLSQVQFVPKENQSVKGGTIGEQAFANCSSLTLFSSPNFTQIESSVFLNCTNLKELYAPNADADNTALVGCINLISLSLGYKQQSVKQNNQSVYKGLNTVAGLRFTDAPNLQTINLPQIVSLSGHANNKSTTIAFLSMANLREATFKQLQNIGYNAFRDCTALTTIKGIDNVTTLQSYAFANCTALTTCGNISNQIIFPQIKTIDTGAFYNCKAITKASFPEVTQIKAQAFSGCEALNTLFAPKAKLENKNAINDCATLQNVTLGITELNENILNKAHATLTTLTLPEATKVNSNFYQNNQYYTALTTLNIPKVTSIGSNAFSNCYALTALNLPQQTLVLKNKLYSNNMTIGNNAFNGCAALKTANIAAENINIGEFCFQSCGLKTFMASGLSANTTAPYTNNIMTFAQGAFCKCSNLATVSIGNKVENGGTQTVNIGTNVFTGCTALTNNGLRIAASNITINKNAFSPTFDDNEVMTQNHSPLTEINNTIFNCDTLTIENLAFADCDTIENIKLTNAKTIIKSMAFAACSNANFKTIDIGGTVTLTPGADTKKVMYSPFQDISNLTTITLNNLAENTVANAFLNATATTLNINGLVSKPATQAFKNNKLENITIHCLYNPNNFSPFSECTALANLTIGLSTINTINLLNNAGGEISANKEGYKGFNLTVNGINYNKANNTYETIDNQEITVAKAFASTKAKTMTFPNLTTITTKATQVFADNTNMTTFTAFKLTSFPDDTFSGCTSLTDVNLEAAPTIQGNIFQNCQKLNTLTIPNVTTISGAAFNGTSFATNTPYTLELPKLETIGVVAQIKNNTTTITVTPFSDCHNFHLKLNKLPKIYSGSTEIGLNSDIITTIFKDSDFLQNSTTPCYIQLPSNIIDSLPEGSPWRKINLLSYKK